PQIYVSSLIQCLASGKNIDLLQQLNTVEYYKKRQIFANFLYRMYSDWFFKEDFLDSTRFHL
ncbi:Protein of unknown function, partial [Gryllus bimaculatus]